MTLHEAIVKVLIDSKKPMTSIEISNIVNGKSLYKKKNGALITPSQVAARVNSYRQLFDNINGEIILAQDKTWSGFVKAFSYLKRLFSRYGVKTDIVIPILFFYKRMDDMGVFDKWSKKDLYSSNKFLNNTSDRKPSQGFYEGIKILRGLFPEIKYGLEEFQKNLEKIDNLLEGDHILIETLDILTTLDTKHLTPEKYGVIFEFFLYKIVNNFPGGHQFTSNTLRNLIAQFIDRENLLDIYDPFSGLNGIFTEINKKHSNVSYYGSEINEDIYNLGLMNLIMHGIDHHHIIKSNSFFSGFNQGFDYIVSDLPFGVRINYYEYIHNHNFNLQVPIRFPKKGDAIALYLLMILKNLKEGGRAIVTIPDFLLIQGGFIREFREYLIKRGYISAVISLPSDLFSSYPNLRASLLVLEKKFVKNQEIIFADLSRSSSNDYSELIRKIRINPNTKYSTSVTIHEIIENDSILGFNAYSEIYRESKRLIREDKAKRLGDLVKIIGGTSKLSEEFVEDGVPIIKMQHLNKDILDLDLFLEDLEDADRVNHSIDKAIISEKVLLLNRIGSQLKPTFFKPNKQFPSIILNNDVYALQVRDSKIVSLEYIYYQFYSPFIQQQITSIQTGIRPHLSIPYLSKIIVPILDIKSQEGFVETQKANLIQLEKEKVEERLRIIGYQEEVADKESDIVRTLVHQLRPIFSSLSAHVDKVVRIAKKNKIEDLQEFEPDEMQEVDPELELFDYSLPKNYTLNEICEKLSDDAQQLNDKLTYVNKVMDFRLEVEDFKETEVFEFLKQYLDLKKMDYHNKFGIKVTGKPVVIELNQQSFKEMIDQLLLNADKHAFRDINKDKRSEVIFNLKENKEKQICVLEYYNNGRDFILTFDEFLRPFVKGQGSEGTGIGGSYIQRIITSHGGSVQLNNKIKQGFGLIFEIPQKQNTNVDNDE